ncbi:hypothetical protein B0H11DRAFT_1953696 [Mycena galericulata]|nr:hypothetical protein B0H11DRAFT_1953696 [Mycena galericulata]
MRVVLQALMVFPWMGGLSGLHPYLRVSRPPACCLACTGSTFVQNSSPEFCASKLWGLSVTVSIYMRWGIPCSIHYGDTSHSRWAPSDEAEYL